jgi:hypothetical protein
MAVTVTVQRRGDLGAIRSTVCDIKLDTSYPTGGYPIALNAVGLETIDAVLTSTSAGYVYDFDLTNRKLKVYWTGAAVSGVLAEVTAATNLSAITVRAVVVGN